MTEASYHAYAFMDWIRDIRVMTTSESTNASDTVNAVKHRKSKKIKSRGQPRMPQEQKEPPG